MTRDRHSDLEWHLQALEPPRVPHWQRPPPARRCNRYRAPPRTSGLRRVLAILAVSLVAAGVALVWHAGPLHVWECVR